MPEPRPSLAARLFTMYLPSGRRVLIVCAFVTLIIVLHAFRLLP